jgi:HAD superfamily hydrolase (TIGR01509 family)
LHFECWSEILTPFGIRLNWEEYARNCIGVSDRAMIRQLAAEVGIDFETLYAQYPRKKQLLHDRMVAAPPMPEAVRQVLKECLPLPIGLVTSSGRLEVEPVLETLGVRELFSTAVFGEDVSRLKPDPEPYLLAARRMGVASPLVFEDSAAGLASARAAGFEAIEVVHPESLPALLQQALRR